MFKKVLELILWVFGVALALAIVMGTIFGLIVGFMYCLGWVFSFSVTVATVYTLLRLAVFIAALLYLPALAYSLINKNK